MNPVTGQQGVTWEALPGALIETVVHGSGEPVALAAALAVIAVLVGVFVFLMLFIVALLGRGPGRAAGLPGARRERRVVTGGVVGIIAVLLLVGSVYAGQTEVCARCHANHVASMSSGTHESVQCVACHRGTGVTGYLLGQVDYVRWIAVSIGGGRQPQRTADFGIVVRSACLRCHGDVADDTVSGGVITVRHTDFLDRSCGDCHNTVGHGEAVTSVRRPDMRICLGCHDGKGLSADCSVCHVGDVALASRRATPRAPAIKVAAPTGTDCRGCHSTQSCNRCHGLEMPHPPDWMPGHAQMAFERPERCWRCHPGPQRAEAGPQPYAECNKCHRFPGPHGSTALWRARHGAAAAKAPGVVGRTRCKLCHRNERFCDLCHDGRRERVTY